MANTAPPGPNDSRLVIVNLYNLVVAVSEVVDFNVCTKLQSLKDSRSISITDMYFFNVAGRFQFLCLRGGILNLFVIVAHFCYENILWLTSQICLDWICIAFFENIKERLRFS